MTALILKNINTKIFRLLVFLIFAFCSLKIKPVIFLNRYIVPELSQIPFLPYRRAYSTLGIQPFVIGSDHAHLNNCFGRQMKDKVGVYELNGSLSLLALQNSISYINPDLINSYPSEWFANNVAIPINLNGEVGGSGFGWNFSYEILNNLIIGWTAAACSFTGILDLNINCNDLTESSLNKVLRTYKNQINNLDLSGKCTTINAFSDQDIYLRYEYATDFVAKMRRIKMSAQLGTIIPTSPKFNIYNPSSFVIGTNGHWGLYAAGEIDLLLKEDVTFGLILKDIIQVANNRKIRVPIGNEPMQYGGYIVDASIAPGNTIMFSTYFSIEGMRRGLGMKLGYSVYDHMPDYISFIDKINIQSTQEERLKVMSRWAQEHILVAAFYDFTREQEEHDFEPFLGLTVQVPVDLFFSKGSVRSYGLTLVFETLY